MEIYLVRVGKRSDGSLYIIRKPHATTEDDYIAISHVWGTPETIQYTVVDGISTKVALSPGKRDILSILRRDDVCGEGWFWMDLFCINQTETSTISITDQLTAIPAIYKSSRRVKVLIEGPVCEVWQSTARQVYESGPIDREVFGEEELSHGRSCPHFMFADPWFERLWTRQEGLYAFVLDFILLNLSPCDRPRKDVTSRRNGWVEHGSLLAYRTKAETFFYDKLAYHGLSATEVEGALFSLYCDVVYKHHVNMLAYNCDPGPAPGYNPIGEGWKSERSTTKARDYVLAVFPDVQGYKVPQGARSLTFPQLLRDAFSQPAVLERFRAIPKVPQGMLVSSGRSTLPWLLDTPLNIGQAYDTFVSVVTDRSQGEDKNFVVDSNIMLEDVDTTLAGLTSLKDDWAHTADVLQHMAFVSPTGPCTAMGLPHHVSSPESLLHQYFAHQFAPIAVSQFLPPHATSQLVLCPQVVIPLSRMPEVPENVFQRELRRFVVCMVCGTSLRTADAVIEAADVVRIPTPYGSLLGIVHAATRRQVKQDQLLLVCSTAWPIHGFWIGLRVNGGMSVIGRTVIPRKEVLEQILGRRLEKGDVSSH